MKIRNAETIRLTPRRAEGLVTAIDTLVVGLCVVAMRLTLPRIDVPGGTLRADGWSDLAATSWGLSGIVLAGILLVTLHHLGHYDRRRPSWQEVGDIAAWALLLGVIDGALALMAGVPLWVPVVCWGASAAALPVVRAHVRRRLDAVGLWRRPTVVVGTGDNAAQAARALLSEPSLGLSVVALADLGGDARRSGVIALGERSLPVMPLERLLAAPYEPTSMPHVVVAPDPDEMAACVAVFERLAATSCDVDFIPPLGGLPLAEARLARFVGSNVAAIRLRDRLSEPLSRFYKRAFDLVVGSALLVLAAPLVGAIALAILLVDGRPVFFWQRRVGMDGRPFACLKFRTMVRDAEARLAALLERDPAARAEWQRDHKLRVDPRISRVGEWLRRTSLDELPQLWNVLRGEMSLIGPRPVVEEELARYGDRAAFYLKTRPGLSGLWQVSGRNDVDYGQRVAMDCQYVRNWTPWWDLTLLLATVRVVLTRRGAY